MGLQSVSNLLPVPHPQLVTSLEPHKSYRWQWRQWINVFMSLVECCRCYSLQCYFKFLIHPTVQCVLCCSADREVALPLHWSYSTQSARQEHNLGSLFFQSCVVTDTSWSRHWFLWRLPQRASENRQFDKLPFLHLQRSVHLANKTPQRWWGCCLVILPSRWSQVWAFFLLFFLFCFVLYFSEEVFFMKIS